MRTRNLRRGRGAALALAATTLAARAAAASRPAEREIRLLSGGIERTCLVHAPAPGAAAMPLLLVLHGGGGTADGMVRLTRGRFEALADRDRFLVVYPQGVGRSWNDGRRDLRSKATRENVDDVGFFRDLIADLSGRYPIDRRRVFAAGMSNGGMMAMRLACALPGELRGAAAVAASLSDDAAAACPSRSAVSVVVVDGTADPIVPYGGGEVKVLWSGRGSVIGGARTADLWAKKAGCRMPPAETDLPVKADDGTRVRRIEYPGCSSGARVVLFRVEGGGHAWPGGVPYLGERMVGKTSGNLSAADAIWELFSSLR